MKRKHYNENMPVGELKQIPDFLPPPGKLVFPEQRVKVTIELNKSSVEFFKRKASLHRTKYQRMLRALIDRYVAQYT